MESVLAAVQEEEEDPKPSLSQRGVFSSLRLVLHNQGGLAADETPVHSAELLHHLSSHGAARLRE